MVSTIRGEGVWLEVSGGTPPVALEVPSPQLKLSAEVSGLTPCARCLRLKIRQLTGESGQSVFSRSSSREVRIRVPFCL